MMLLLNPKFSKLSLCLLVGHDDLPLESFVKVADSMLAVTQNAQPSEPFAVAAARQTPEVPNSQTPSNRFAGPRPFHQN